MATATAVSSPVPPPSTELPLLSLMMMAVSAAVDVAWSPAAATATGHERSSLYVGDDHSDTRVGQAGGREEGTEHRGDGHRTEQHDIIRYGQFCYKTTGTGDRTRTRVTTESDRGETKCTSRSYQHEQMQIRT